MTTIRVVIFWSLLFFKMLKIARVDFGTFGIFLIPFIKVGFEPTHPRSFFFKRCQTRPLFTFLTNIAQKLTTNGISTFEVGIQTRWPEDSRHIPIHWAMWRPPSHLHSLAQNCFCINRFQRSNELKRERERNDRLEGDLFNNDDDVHVPRDGESRPRVHSNFCKLKVATILSLQGHSLWWLSWKSGCFQYQRSTVWIHS